MVNLAYFLTHKAYYLKIFIVLWAVTGLLRPFWVSKFETVGLLKVPFIWYLFIRMIAHDIRCISLSKMSHLWVLSTFLRPHFGLRVALSGCLYQFRYSLETILNPKILGRWNTRGLMVIFVSFYPHRDKHSQNYMFKNSLTTPKIFSATTEYAIHWGYTFSIQSWNCNRTYIRRNPDSVRRSRKIAKVRRCPVSDLKWFPTFDCRIIITWIICIVYYTSCKIFIAYTKWLYN